MILTIRMVKKHKYCTHGRNVDVKCEGDRLM